MPTPVQQYVHFGWHLISCSWLQEQSQRTGIYDKLFLSPVSCTFCRLRMLFSFCVTSCQIYLGALMPYGLINMAASLSSWGWAEEWPDRAVCQIWEINSQPFPPSSVIGCLLPSDLIIIQAVQIGLDNEGPWSLCSYCWLLRLGPLLLSSAAVKLDIQPKPVIAFCLCGQWEERERIWSPQSDSPHPKQDS